MHATSGLKQVIMSEFPPHGPYTLALSGRLEPVLPTLQSEHSEWQPFSLPLRYASQLTISH